MNFPFFSQRKDEWIPAEVRDRENALASTRDACAPRNSQRDLVEVPCCFALSLGDVARF